MRIFAGQKMTEAGCFLLHDAAEHLFRGIATLCRNHDAAAWQSAKMIHGAMELGLAKIMQLFSVTRLHSNCSIQLLTSLELFPYNCYIYISSTNTCISMCNRKSMCPDTADPTINDNKFFLNASNLDPPSVDLIETRANSFKTGAHVK